jgi:hypothetical protein
MPEQLSIRREKKKIWSHIWLIRAGSHGEYEQKFITESRAYVN